MQKVFVHMYRVQTVDGQLFLREIFSVSVLHRPSVKLEQNYFQRKYDSTEISYN